MNREGRGERALNQSFASFASF
ncbi:MAG: hypothetical protein JWL60_539, partial [Gemmatimonadetes bacterium]|nr:hypothetical protein [Gemmatimonadota bacterium]